MSHFWQRYRFVLATQDETALWRGLARVLAAWPFVCGRLRLVDPVPVLEHGGARDGIDALVFASAADLRAWKPHMDVADRLFTVAIAPHEEDGGAMCLEMHYSEILFNFATALEFADAWAHALRDDAPPPPTRHIDLADFWGARYPDRWLSGGWTGARVPRCTAAVSALAAWRAWCAGSWAWAWLALETVPCTLAGLTPLSLLAGALGPLALLLSPRQPPMQSFRATLDAAALRRVRDATLDADLAPLDFVAALWFQAHVHTSGARAPVFVGIDARAAIGDPEHQARLGLAVERGYVWGVDAAHSWRDVARAVRTATREGRDRDAVLDQCAHDRMVVSLARGFSLWYHLRHTTLHVLMQGVFFVLMFLLTWLPAFSLKWHTRAVCALERRLLHRDFFGTMCGFINLSQQRAPAFPELRVERASFSHTFPLLLAMPADARTPADGLDFVGYARAETVALFHELLARSGLVQDASRFFDDQTLVAWTACDARVPRCGEAFSRVD